MFRVLGGLLAGALVVGVLAILAYYVAAGGTVLGYVAAGFIAVMGLGGAGLVFLALKSGDAPPSPRSVVQRVSSRDEARPSVMARAVGRSPSGGRWRRVVLYMLALVFAGSGLLVGGGGIAYGLRTGKLDDAVAGAFLGGCLLVVGVLIFWVARKMARRARPPADLAAVSEQDAGHGMNIADQSDWSGGDDGNSAA